MKRFSILMLLAAVCTFTANNAHSQIKVGVFDIDLMVEAMPGYHVVDSALNVYQTDSLGGEYQYYLSEYQRLDSVLKNVDTPGVKTGAVTAVKIKFDNDQKQQLLSTLVNWRNIAQQKYNNKKGELSQTLYRQVATSYQKIVIAKGYAVVLKPGTYEFGPRIDNIFISVAKDLKLTGLPQELLQLGVDPDTPAQQATNSGANGSKTGAKPASH